MKARYRYRIYPTLGQQSALAKLFGCTRVVWNDALAHCIKQYREGNKKPSNGQLQKQFITQAKQTDERQWLSEVSSIPCLDRQGIPMPLGWGGCQPPMRSMVRY